MVLLTWGIFNRSKKTAQECSNAQASQLRVSNGKASLALQVLIGHERILGFSDRQVDLCIINMIARAELLVLETLHHGLSFVATFITLVILIALATLLLCHTRLTFIIFGLHFIIFVLFILFLLHDFILEPSAQIWIFLFGASMLDCRIKVLPQPIFNIVSLRVEEMKDPFDAVFLRKYLVMLLLLLKFFVTFIREGVISSYIRLPELLLVSHFALKVLPVRFDNRIVLFFT